MVNNGGSYVIKVETGPIYKAEVNTVTTVFFIGLIYHYT